MPLYEYYCPKCQHAFEELVRGDEQPECPQCRGKVERLLSIVAAHSRSSVSQPSCGPAPPPPGGCGAPWCGTGGCGS